MSDIKLKVSQPIIKFIFEGVPAPTPGGNPAWASITDKPTTFTPATHNHALNDLSEKSYNNLTDKPVIPAAQINSDWNATTGLAKIENKPSIPAAQVQSDWEATEGMGQILNKPTIPPPGLSLPIGSMVRSSQAPSASWLRCDGSVYAQSTRPLLYAQVGLLHDFAGQSEIALGGYYITVHNRLAYGNGRFVGCGVRCGFSTDNGDTWTQGLVITTNADLWGSFRGLAYSPSLDRWVMVGNAGDCYTSDDGGAHWTSRTSSFASSNISDVVWTGSYFAACGAGGKVATSANGIDWNQQTSVLAWTNLAITYSIKGEFLVVGDENGYTMTSHDDGVTWVRGVNIGYVLSMGYCDALGLVMAGESASSRISYSRDGVSWKTETYGAANSYTGSIYSDGEYFYFICRDAAVYRMGSDLVIRPIVKYAALYSGAIVSANGTLLFAGKSGSDYTVGKATRSYNASTSFRLPSPALDAGITHDTWILGDTI